MSGEPRNHHASVPSGLTAGDVSRLVGAATGLLAFARGARHPAGGYGWLDQHGRLVAGRPVETWITCRMTHCFALGQLRHDDYAEDVDWGLRALRGRLRDAVNGGWHSAVDGVDARAGSKEAYAHAFVVLAASSAATAGQPEGERLLDEALATIEQRFWDEAAGLVVDVWASDWSVLDDYRGANANMHAVEAFLAAADATGDAIWRERALRILRRVVHGFARTHQWRLPEHFDHSWQATLNYNRDEPAHPFRPFGVTIGHLFEWARLCVHAKVASGASAPAWLIEDARALYWTAGEVGWAADGRDGFVYTTDFEDNPIVRERMHWVAAEAIAAAWAMYVETQEACYLDDYRRWWQYVESAFVDHTGGSWWHELDPDNRPSARVWEGKPDVYHAYQATILPLLPPAGSFIGAAKGGW